MTTATDEHIRIARDCGYDGVEIRAERLLDRPHEVETAARIVRPGEVWGLNGIQVRLAADGSLDADRLATDLDPRLDVCEALRAEYLLIVPPRGPIDRRGAHRGLRDGIARIRDSAAARDVEVAFEFLGFADCPIDTPERAARLVQGLEGVDLVLDSCHWHASGGGGLDAFPIDRLAMTHLNDVPRMRPREIEDSDRLLPSHGVIELPALVSALRAAKYDGPWSLETFNTTYWEMDPRVVSREGRGLMSALLGTTA